MFSFFKILHHPSKGVVCSEFHTGNNRDAEYVTEDMNVLFEDSTGNQSLSLKCDDSFQGVLDGYSKPVSKLDIGSPDN